MNKGEVVIVLGSKSDEKRIEDMFNILEHFGIKYTKKIYSAHRTPDEVVDFIKNLNQETVSVIIAVAGAAAHLPGVIASHTIIPVVGVPIANPPHNGMDSILSIIEMPKGVPVVGVGAGSGGAGNAALFAVRILCSHDSKLREKYLLYIKEMKKKIIELNQ